MEDGGDVQGGPQDGPVLGMVILQHDLRPGDADVLWVRFQVVAQEDEVFAELFEFGPVLCNLVVGLQVVLGEPA